MGMDRGWNELFGEGGGELHKTRCFSTRTFARTLYREVIRQRAGMPVADLPNKFHMIDVFKLTVAGQKWHLQPA